MDADVLHDLKSSQLHIRAVRMLASPLDERQGHMFAALCQHDRRSHQQALWELLRGPWI